MDFNKLNYCGREKYLYKTTKEIVLNKNTFLNIYSDIIIEELGLVKGNKIIITFNETELKDRNQHYFIQTLMSTKYDNLNFEIFIHNMIGQVIYKLSFKDVKFVNDNLKHTLTFLVKDLKIEDIEWILKQ